MKKIIDILTEELENAFEKCDIDSKFAKVSVSNRPDLCEYQCNGAMAAAKQYKTAPIKIAEKVVEALKDSTNMRDVTAVMPGFINFNLNDEFVADYVNDMAKDEKFGYEPSEKNKSIVVDYGGANVAKPDRKSVV